MKKVLIEDDDPNIRLIFSTTLQQNGFEVKTASTGLEALQMVLDDTYDLIILDIKMPDIHGLEVLSLVRESGFNVPVVICSAFEGMKEDFVIQSSNVYEYLVKPIDLKILNSVAKKACASAS